MRGGLWILVVMVLLSLLLPSTLAACNWDGTCDVGEDLDYCSDCLPDDCGNAVCYGDAESCSSCPAE